MGEPGKSNPGNFTDTAGNAIPVDSSPSRTATGASVLSLGLSAYSSILKGEGIKSADEYKAASLENAAQRGRVAAVQTGAAESAQLATHLGNIDAIRAAAHTDPTSPTGAAVRDWHEQLGLTKKAIDVDNIIAQANQQASDAAYLRQAGKFALTQSYLQAGTDAAAALAKAV